VLQYRFEVSQPGADSSALAESAAHAVEATVTTAGAIVDSWIAAPLASPERPSAALSDRRRRLRGGSELVPGAS
jgi:hypothetical protein